MRPSFTCLVFDFDGTVADTFQATLRITNQMAQEFGFRGVPDQEVERFKNMSLPDVIRHLNVPLLKIPAIASRARELMASSMASIHPFPGIPDVLNRLHQEGLRLIILTTNSLDNVNTFLQTHNLDIFHRIVTTRRVWGKSWALKELVKKEGLNTKEVLYVGDESRDIEAAQKSHTPIAAVTWGYNTRTVLERHNPDFWLEKPEDLLNLVAMA